MGDPTKALVIDCHAQVGEGESWAEPKRPVNYKVELVLERAAEAGIDRSCVSAPQNPSYEQANRQVARLCEKYPDRLIGFAVHNPQRETGRVKATLTEEVKSMGFKGLKSDGHPTREILDVIAELGIPVIYCPAPRLNLVAMFHWMTEAYPSVNFILPHLGAYRSSPSHDHITAIDLAKRHPNLYLEASGMNVHFCLEMAARDLPAEQIVFGSNAPECDPRVEIYAIKLLGSESHSGVVRAGNPIGHGFVEFGAPPKLSPDQEAKILGGNIQRLLGHS